MSKPFNSFETSFFTLPTGFVSEEVVLDAENLISFVASFLLAAEHPIIDKKTKINTKIRIIENSFL